MAPLHPLRVLILAMHTKGVSVKNISNKLSMSRKTTLSTIKRYGELGSTNGRPRRGRPVAATVSQNVKHVRELVRRNPKRSLRKLTKPSEVSKSSRSCIVNEELGLKSYRWHKAHILVSHMMNNSLIKGQTLIQRFNSARYRDVIFSNEKSFTVEATLNRQNYCMLAKSVAEANELGRIHERSGHPESGMI